MSGNPCSDCLWFLPNLYKKFMHRVEANPKCGIAAFKEKEAPEIDKLQVIKWDPNRSGCERFERFSE